MMTVMVMLGVTSIESHSQDEAPACPCFSFAEVESIFTAGAQLTAEQGISDCSAQDYSVELSAEVIVWDQNYTMLAQARVEWFDFDPATCTFTDTYSEPDIERNEWWPHPAPEETARACLDIISGVIKKLDESGKCNTYP